MTPQEYRELERGRLALERCAAALERIAGALEGGGRGGRATVAALEVEPRGAATGREPFSVRHPGCVFDGDVIRNVIGVVAATDRRPALDCEYCGEPIIVRRAG